MELARALTSRRRHAAGDATGGPARAFSMKHTRAGSSGIKRSAISSPMELVSSTNVLAYNAPNIYPVAAASGSLVTSISTASSTMSDESDASLTFSGSSRATTPDTECLSPIEPNHLSAYFNSASRNNSIGNSQQSQGISEGSDGCYNNNSPNVPSRMVSHTKRSHQVAATNRRESLQRSQPPPTCIHQNFSRVAHTNTTTTSDIFGTPDASHPFGAELAQVNEVAEGFSAREVLFLDEEEQFLAEHGLCKFGVEDYIDELQALFGGNPFGAPGAGWL